MIRYSFYAVMVVMAMFASAVYLLKYDVQSLKQDNARMQKQIADERLALELLQAEWVYLNRPSRLQALAKQHLQAVPMQPQKVISIIDIPRRDAHVAQLQQE